MGRQEREQARDIPSSLASPIPPPPGIYSLLLSEALAGPGAHVAASFGQKALQSGVLCKVLRSCQQRSSEKHGHSCDIKG